MSDDYRTVNNPFASIANYDPIHAMFLKRKKQEVDGVDLTVKEHNMDDVVALEEFCRKYGIVGVNFGNMSPRSTLKMLKGKMGIVDNPIQCEERRILKG